jgi:two-component system chemotaxis response regulator CheB
MSPPAPVRALIFDDSAASRSAIEEMLSSDPEVRVVATAQDGEEGLAKVFAERPDVITLDLEMPRLDGFGFLRILMSRRPTPVLVLSSQGMRQSVLRALELGALDFIPKPSSDNPAALRSMRDELCAKVKLVRQMGAGAVEPRRAPAVLGRPSRSGGDAPARRIEPAALRVVALGASTGGPAAISALLSVLERDPGTALLVNQHMPPRFTTTFAERLHRLGSYEVREAKDGDGLEGGVALVAPGGSTLSLEAEGSRLLARIAPPGPRDRFVPSIDHLFESVARTCGARALGVVLSGMAGDVAHGVRAIKAAGGRIVVQSPETAIFAGMPEEAIATGAADRVVPLAEMAEVIARFSREGSV